MKKSLWLILACVLALSLAVSGCSNSSSSTGKEKDSDGSSAGKGEDSDYVLIYGRGGDSDSLDPAMTTEGESYNVTDSIYETLVQFGKDNTEVEAGLAEKWDISPDATKFTFHLREGVKFHDGTDFNAEAVVKNFQRWSQSKDEAKFAYYPSMFGGFEGDESHVIKEVKAVDEKTVEFTLNRPQAPFLKNLAMSPFAIASPTAFEKGEDSLAKNPVGTGPFKFVSWKPNDIIDLERNEDYWQEGLPKLAGVKFKVIKDNSARLNALIKGELDIIDGLNPSDMGKVEADKNLALYERPSLNTGYLGFNVEKEPFNKKEVRQAISHLVNKEEIIKNFFEGTAQPATNPIPPSVSGYNDAIQDREYDVEKAKELLKKAGLEKGFKMDLWAMPIARPYMPNGQKVAEALQASFKEANIDVNIVTFEWGTYLDKLRAGEASVFMVGWNGDNGDADNFLYTLLDKDTIGSNNYSRYANEEVHKLLIEAQSIADENKRNELYKKAQEIIFDDAPWVPLVHSTPMLAGSSKVQDFVPHPTGSQSFIDVSVSK
ncbi:ABC transporter substrate-binding protein [Peribacillus saganii]|uniref:ABC transporter substrate-binding protein n=1 Tax=Peribacillus saganii TaxID=2303992 RepID=A0A372LKH7_9BACI|nr:ABC transporter substrate-binding protein [Peribacillus saganii]RFU67102.1 ABC transporter substrate-binding protein [Peribacillus saganii]